MKCYECDAQGFLVWHYDMVDYEDEYTEEDYLNVQYTSDIFWYNRLDNNDLVQLTVCPYCDGIGVAA